MRQMVNSRFAGRLVVGTDAGTALNFNTDTTRREVGLFVKWGMTPLDAISAATRLSAQALGKGAEFGTVDPGNMPTSSSLMGTLLRTWQSSRTLSMSSRRAFNTNDDVAIGAG